MRPANALSRKLIEGTLSTGGGDDRTLAGDESTVEPRPMKAPCDLLAQTESDVRSVGTRYPVSKPLRGRDEELGRLLKFMVAGTGVAVVSGLPGSGRTRLLEAAFRWAHDHGFAVLSGRGDPSTRGVPFALFAPLLARSAGGGADGQPPPILTEQVRDLLTESARRQPTVYFLDDVHLADQQSLLALRDLAAAPTRVPVGWLLGRRSTAMAPAVDALSTVPSLAVDVLNLAPLSGDAVARMVEDILGGQPEPDLLKVVDRAAGYPLLVRALVEGMREEGGLEIRDGRARITSARLPARVIRLVRSELDAVSPRSRLIIQAAVGFGPGFPVDDLRDALEDTTVGLLLAIDEAITAGIITGDGGQLTFRSELVREAVTALTPPPVRTSLDRRVGEVLLARGNLNAPAVEHVLRAASLGNVRMAEAMTAAAGTLLPSAPQRAAELAVKATELATTKDDRVYCAAMAVAVRGLIKVGSLSRALHLVKTALVRVPPAQVALAADLRCSLAVVLAHDDRFDESVAEAEQVLRSPELPDPVHETALSAWLFGLLRLDRDRARRYAEAILGGRDAEPPAPGVDPTRTASPELAAMVLSFLEWQDGRFTSALRLTDESGRPGLPTGRTRLDRHLALAHRHLVLGDLDRAEAHIRALRETVDETAAPVDTARTLLLRGRLAFYRGRLDEAETLAAQASVLACSLNHADVVRVAQCVLATVALRKGDLLAASQRIRRYSGLLGEGRDPFVRAATALVVQKACAYTDGVAASWELLADECAILTEKPGITEQPAAIAWLVRCAIEAGDRSRATRLVTAAEELRALNPGLRMIEAVARHARGLLDHRLDGLRRAAVDYPDPWLRASALEDLGTLLAADATPGDRDSAVQALKSALEGYTRVGAQRDAARLRSRLRLLGIRPRHWQRADRSATGWPSLTETERAVADLIARGMSKKQAAEQMYLSPHTIDTHLRHVYRKLGISSRAQLRTLHAQRDG